MKERIRKIGRILKVQQHLHREAELRLANLEREVLELRSTQETVIQSMNDHETLHGLFVDVAAKRLQALAAQEGRVEKSKAVQKKATFERAMQVKQTEKMLDGLNEERRIAEDKKSLASILETIAQKGSASFP